MDQTNEKEVLECSICLDELNDNIRILPCAHKFHKNCIESWEKINANCPICRNSTSDTLIVRGRKFKNIFVRYYIVSDKDKISIRTYMFDINVKNTIIKYSLIKKIEYDGIKFILSYKSSIENNDLLHLKFKLFKNAYERFFFFLKNKIQIIT